MLSRVFGLIRDQIFAATLGAGFFADCFIIAFRIPNLFRDLFAEGALSNAFVPTLTKTLNQDGQAQSKVLIAKLMGLLTIIVGLVVLLGIVFSGHLAAAIAPGFASVPGKLEQTRQLTQILFPFLFFISFASVMMGVHHVHRSFTRPALAPFMFNVCSIGGGLVIYMGQFKNSTAVIIWSVGTLVGGVSQCMIQIPWLVKNKHLMWPSFRNIWKHKRLREMLYLMVPAIIALSGVQVNILINTILASLLQEGAPSWLNYGFRLTQLPIGIFAVAIGVVTLAQTSKDAADKNPQRLRDNTSAAMTLNWALSLPCAVGLWIMAKPIVSLIFERGAFTPFDTEMTALAIQWYAIGIPLYAGVKVKGPVFFTQNFAKIPMVASLVGIMGNISFNLATYRQLGHGGLALGTSIGLLINFSILTWYFQKKFQVTWSLRTLMILLKIILSTVLMGIFAYVLSSYFIKNMGPISSFTSKLFHVGTVIIGSILIYALSLKLCRLWDVFAPQKK